MKCQICTCGRENFENRPCTIYDKNMAKRNMRRLRLESKYLKTKYIKNLVIVIVLKTHIMKCQICTCGRENFENRPCTIYDKNMAKRNMRRLRLESKYLKTKTKENFYLHKKR